MACPHLACVRLTLPCDDRIKTSVRPAEFSGTCLCKSGRPVPPTCCFVTRICSKWKAFHSSSQSMAPLPSSSMRWKHSCTTCAKVITLMQTDSPHEGDGPARHRLGVAQHARRAWSCSRSARSSFGRTGWPRLRIHRQTSALVKADTPSIRQYPIPPAGPAPRVPRPRFRRSRVARQPSPAA